MLTVYDQYEEFSGGRDMRNVPLVHLASSLAGLYGYQTMQDVAHAIDCALRLCADMAIPIQRHFQRVYVFHDNCLESDWLLSDLGGYLLYADKLNNSFGDE